MRIIFCVCTGHWFVLFGFRSSILYPLYWYELKNGVALQNFNKICRLNIEFGAAAFQASRYLSGDGPPR